MKAIQVNQFGGPEVLQVVDLPDPTAGPGQLVVRTMAIGVNPVDTYIRAGKYGPKSFPFVPGTDAAGVVEAVGSGVDQFKPNDRVYVYGSVGGAYAEKVLCNVSQVYPLPAKLSFEQGAAIGVPYGTAYRALVIRGHAKAGETLLVHGASGGVGTAAVQIGKSLGLNVIGTAGTKEGLELVKKQGAQHAVSHHDKNYLEQIMSFTGDKGLDLIIELLANVNLEKDLGIVVKRGRVVVVGSRGRIEIDPRQLMIKDSDIRGMSLMHADAAELAGIHQALAKGFNSGEFSPVIGKKFPLAQAAVAHEAVMEGGAHGKIILTTG